jgi:hypothetical protein
MVRGLGVIGLVAASLLLCTAQSFEPAPKLYRAKPEDVPPWAEQGNFRFIRLDGGQIESWKAGRTWWGKKFSAEEKDVLTHSLYLFSQRSPPDQPSQFVKDRPNGELTVDWALKN